jgi:competence protein ComEC
MTSACREWIEMEKQVSRATPGRAVRAVRAGWQDGRADGAGPDDGEGGHGDPAPSRGGGAFLAMAGWIGGTALQLQQPALWDAAVYGVVGLAGLLGLAVRAAAPIPGRRSRLGGGFARGATCLLLAALAGAGATGWRAARYAADALDPGLEGRDLQVVGVVAGLPQHGEGGTRFALAVESVRRAAAPTVGRADAGAAEGPPVARAPDRIALAWYAEGTARPPPLHAGERWRLTVRLRAPHGDVNPHGFDTELWMWTQGVRASGYVRAGANDAAPLRLAATGRHPVERAREAVRDAVFERIADRRVAGVVAALVTGDQGAIERADWDVFRATGVAHLMSISGLHVTMFAALASFAVGAAWRRSARLMRRWPAQRAALAGGVALAAAYALFSGGGVPAQRTVWMLATVALLRLSGRRWPWPCVWLLAGGVAVAIDPWALLQAGFWLSFVAVAALFATDTAPAVDHRGPGWRRRLARLAREQAVVTLALTPLTLLLFQQVSVVGLAANAAAIPWVTLVVTPLAMAGVVAPPLWDLAALAVQALAWGLQGLAALPFATLSMAAPPVGLAVCGVAGGVIASMRLPWRLRLLGLPLLLPVLLWQPARPAVGEFELLAADVGQGNAVLVRTATRSLLYDAGPRYNPESDAGVRVLVPLLRALGERLDTVVLSHRDSDHTGGAAAVLASQPRAALLASIEDGHPLQALRPARRCVAGQRWSWDGVDFEVLHPLEHDHDAPGAKPNALSCVLRIGNGRAAALLAGDIERAQEAALVGRAAEGALRADVLLVPHHGSRTSSSPPLLDAVAPRLALVQAGWRNRFGHPAPAVVEAYAARGVALVDSPHCGAAGWSSRAPGEVRCERAARARYWHHRVP